MAKIEKRALTKEITAPAWQGALDTYRTAQVTSRIGAQVVSRRARLGQMINKGQLLATLSSVAMAKA
jgi:cobalt-zinc-cadmium efflux system membrane fusion protein